MLFRSGKELIDDEIDTNKAYEFFRSLEEKEREDTIRVPDVERGGLFAPVVTELPS